jgi:hypothetical protein
MRLLNLFSSSPENPQIECKLVAVDIDPKKLTRGSIGKEYEALSWCWGTAQPTAYINIQEEWAHIFKEGAAGLAWQLSKLCGIRRKIGISGSMRCVSIRQILGRGITRSK